MGKISSVPTEVNLFITIRQASKKVTAVHCNRTEIRGRNFRKIEKRVTNSW